MNESKGGLIPLLLLGVVSALLYALLFIYSDLIVELAIRVREGEKAYFLLPIVIAFLFSFVHGAFTGRFWAYLGLEAKK